MFNFSKTRIAVIWPLALTSQMYISHCLQLLQKQMLTVSLLLVLTCIHFSRSKLPKIKIIIPFSSTVCTNMLHFEARRQKLVEKLIWSYFFSCYKEGHLKEISNKMDIDLVVKLPLKLMGITQLSSCTLYQKYAP